MVAAGLPDQTGGNTQDSILISLTSDDSLSRQSSDDVIHCHYAEENLLDGTDRAMSLSDNVACSDGQIADLDGGL